MADVTPTGPIVRPRANQLQETVGTGAVGVGIGGTLTNPPPVKASAASSGLAIGGVYTAAGTENPSGFDILFASLTPPIVPPSGYVAIAQAKAAAGLVECTVTNQTALKVTVETATQLAAGDTVTIILSPN